MVSQVDMVVWFIGAIFLIFVVHPYMLSRKIRRDGLTKDEIVKSVKEEVVDPMIRKINMKLNTISDDISHNIYDVRSLITADIESVAKRIDSMSTPLDMESIPSIDDIRDLVRKAATINADHLEEVRKGMPGMIIQTLNSSEAEALFKSYEGRMYRMKGINIEDHQKGIEAAQQVYMEKVENDDPGDHTEIKMIIKDAIKIASEGGLIDPENIDQKIGLVEGILRIGKRLKQYSEGRPAGKGSAGMKPAR